MSGELELEITPQGTLAEKIRAGGAGIPAFYTATGVNTLVQTGGFPYKFKPGTKETEVTGEVKEVRSFTVPVNTSAPLVNNEKVLRKRDFILEKSIFGDVAIIRAHKADHSGNLVYRHATR
jgi:acyl CoA:acetate/3-ketoacid CoA transferase alpha subunit